jgi:hypothetical protein
MVTDVAAGDTITRGAVRFFRIWPILATSVSVAGNVAHAVLTAPSAMVPWRRRGGHWQMRDIQTVQIASRNLSLHK